MTRKPIIWGGILSLLCWSLLFSPIVSSAHAATPTPPCYGSSCYGLDPFTTKCGIVTSYNSLPHLAKPIPTMMSNGIAYGPTIGTIINYYSTWCNANWAEATMNNTTGISINIAVTQPTVQQKYEPASGFYYGQTGYPMWTDMVNGTDLAHACAVLVTWEAGPGNVACADQ